MIRQSMNFESIFHGVFNLLIYVIISTIIGTFAFSGESEVISLDLSISHERHMLGEPLILNLRVSNVSGKEFKAEKTPIAYINKYIEKSGSSIESLDRNEMPAFLMPTLRVLGPDESWTYPLPVILDVREPGEHEIWVEYPLINARPSGDKKVIPSRRYKSRPIKVLIQAPEGDDNEVLRAIREPETHDFLATGYETRKDKATILRVARLLKEHPETGYHASLRLALQAYSDRTHPDPHSPEGDAIRQALGFKDRRLFPDDHRLDRKVTLKFPDIAPMRQAVEAVQLQSGIPLSLSPDSLTSPRDTMSSSAWNPSVRNAMLFFSERSQRKGLESDPAQVWVRRGDGYYLYHETLDETLESRKDLVSRHTPLPALFPEDDRLDNEVISYFPKRTNIDRVFSSYTKQSGITLGGSPFVARCQKNGQKMSLKLREEMAFLALTFGATWERRGDGYILSAGADADRNVPPPPKVKADH